jgi:phosphatidylglycerol:prolipoprotein diacylglycerol transferase
MLIHPNFDPVALQLGPLAVHWYGLMYLFGFAGFYLLANYRASRYPFLKAQHWSGEQISDLVFYGALGAVLGGRIGYALFYKFNEYLTDPVAILKVWQGGMSFHGGLLGVGVALLLFAKKSKLSFWQVADFVAPAAPIGLFFGRMGNFINQELWGKTTQVPWGMVFTNGGPLPRHPSMLYEAILEGLVLLAIVWWFASKSRKPGQVTGMFLVFYAVFRFVVEFVRVPDQHLQYLLFNWVTMGQLLCVPMIIYGMYLLLRQKVKN